MLTFLSPNKPSLSRFVFVLSTLLLTACGEQQVSFAPSFSFHEHNPGGDTSVGIAAKARFDMPAANLPNELKTHFHAGKALAQQPWVKAPTITTSRDGLGPLYNARTCMACHVNGGKGFIPDDTNVPIRGTLVRLSKSGKDPKAGVIAHPVYGDQIQGQSTSLAHQLRHIPSAQSNTDVKPEAYVHINWQSQVFIYPDQRQVTLRTPTLDFRNLGYGPIGGDTLLSLRVAPMIHGMGLIELIPQSQIKLLSDSDDINQDGISGRINQVWDIEKQKTVPGRFGLKANKPTLAMTVAGAFANDLGISNSLFPSQPCTGLQKKCSQAHNGNDKNGVELTQRQLDLTIDFNRNLAPPKARNLDNPDTQAGRELFYATGCQLCHQPSFTTQKSERFAHLSKQVIWPYSDFLLHDLGPELADNRPDFEASGQEWRTSPLWGIGLREAVNGSRALLHDGRAKTIEEAILWHGGEARSAKESFIRLNQTQRENLMLFVKSI